MSEIAGFFAEKSVFVTGATGFLGKVLIEKLLRSCGSIGNIYVLIRPKRNESAEQRYEQFAGHSAFEYLRSNHPERLSKLKFINGDITTENLGLSEDDKFELIQQVQFVFHCAAIVKFDKSLYDILKVNLKGTQRVLELATMMKNLKSLAFVSTAYSQSYQKDLEERNYPTGYDVGKVLQFIDSNNTESMRSIEDELSKKGHPTTYTMSKAIAEDFVYSYRQKLPLVIIRPSIIMSAVHDPEGGYVEGLQGMTGFIAASMSGVSKNKWIDRSKKMSVMPVDFTANVIIASSYQRSLDISKEPTLFYNCSNSPRNSVTWGVFNNESNKNSLRFAPSKQLVYYPRTGFVSNYLMFSVLFFLTQFLPALLYDLAMLLIGRKTIMTKVQLKLFKALKGIGHFCTNEFEISVDNILKLSKSLNAKDRQIFNFNTEKIDWPRLFKTQAKGIRKLIFLENSDTIPKAQQKIRRLFFVDIMVKSVLVMIGTICVFNLFNDIFSR